MEFRLLGPVEVLANGTRLELGTPQQRVVLAALAVDAGRPVTLATLADRVWDASPPVGARPSLYAHVARIRNLLAPAVTLVRRAGGYLLDIDPDDVDLRRFRRLTVAARDRQLPDAERADLLRTALDLWRGAPLADLAGGWAARMRVSVHKQQLDAVVQWAHTQLRLGRPDEVIDALRELAAEHPRAEPLAGALMLAYVAAGQDAEALDCYATTRARLVTEFGTEPGPTLRAVHAAVLRGEAVTPGGAPGPGTAPLGAAPLAAAAPAQPPGATVPGATVPGNTVLGATVLGATVLGATVPGATVPGATAVGATVSGAAVPGAAPIGAVPPGAAAMAAVPPGGAPDGVVAAGGTAWGQAASVPVAVPAGTGLPVAAEPGPAAAPAGRAGAVPAQLPADVPAFTGRGRELAELDRLPRGGHMLAVLSGTAGVGKTALAVRWGHTVREWDSRGQARTGHGFPDGQLYVDLRGYDPGEPVPPADALAGFLTALGVRDVPAGLDDRAARFRTETARRRLLIVLDNAANVDQVRPLLPGAPTCFVLVTSRDSLPGLVARHGAVRLGVDLLPLEDAVALLAALVGERVRAEPGAAAALATRCARLPLALRLAAEYAAGTPSVPLSRLVGGLSDDRRLLAMLAAGGDRYADVRTVFSWSYRELPVSAAQAFRLLATHPAPDLDPCAAAAVIHTSVDRAQHLLDVLARAHLVQHTRRGATDTGRYNIHNLLRAYATQLPEPNGRGRCPR